jgi:hypothetical protein
VASSGVDGGRRCGVDGVVPLAVDAVAARPLLCVSWPIDLSRKALSVQGGEGALSTGSSGACSAASDGGGTRHWKNKLVR